MDLTDILFDIPEKLRGFANTLFDWIFTEITIGDLTLSVWQVIGGVGIVALILFSIIKN